MSAKETFATHWPKIGAWYLTLLGLHHLVFPKAWERLTAIAYPNDTRRWVYAFGISEGTSGLLFHRRETRPFAMAWLVAQVLFIFYRFGTVRGAKMD